MHNQEEKEKMRYLSNLGVCCFGKVITNYEFSIMMFNFFKRNDKNFQKEQEKFLEGFVFKGLTNLNNGFDVESIFYFSEEEFHIVIKRLKSCGIIILGIEPWIDGDFYDVISYENYDLEPDNYEWVYKAMDGFKKRNLKLQYSASYFFPNGIPKIK